MLIDLYHPVLGKTVRVRERAARILERSGWIAALPEFPPEEPAENVASEEEAIEEEEE